MIEVSATLRAALPSDTIVPLAAAINALHDGAWRQLSIQLPRKGVVAVGALHAAPGDQRLLDALFPDTPFDAVDIVLLANCSAVPLKNGIDVQCVCGSVDDVERLAQLLRRLGGSLIEATVCTEGLIEHPPL